MQKFRESPAKKMHDLGHITVVIHIQTIWGITHSVAESTAIKDATVIGETLRHTSSRIGLFD